MENIATIVVAIILAILFGALVVHMFQRRRINSEIMKLQAEITLSVQEGLRDTITSYRDRVDQLESDNKRLSRMVRDLDRLFESVLAGCWTLYHQVQSLGEIPLFTPPKQHITHLEDDEK